eukprot:TRINITY_DN8592_c0_g1_i2.p1 TRINITY_DN8592_c0_g1~~TRINITY_DN8592_c0_g1_i2.p1  ORF type:complete len:269 (-),score=46.46 TRINITY_DN8592_c0_g1_i2:78-884(-)
MIRSIFQKLTENDEKSTFEVINLSDNKIGDDGAEFLQLGLTGNTHLKKLYLPRCGIGAKGFGSMGSLLAGTSSLEEIVLSSNVCGVEGMEGSFCEGLAKNTTLKSLYLGACRLGNQGVAPFCAGPMKTHPSLEHLSLTYNRLDASCVIPSLNPMLAGNAALRYLDLSGNTLGPRGAQELVTGLTLNKGCLQKLSLAQNELKHEGCRALALFFVSAEGSKMEFLDLRHNQVTYARYVALGEEFGKPMNGEDDNGWLWLFGQRQLFLNAH